MPPRRFTLPWSVEEQPACFVVRDHDGQQLAYVYFDDRRAPGPVVSITRPRFARANRATLELRY